MRELLTKEQHIPRAVSSTLEVLLLVVQLPVYPLGLNNRSSSNPPSSNRNRSDEKRAGQSRRKAGSQPGSVGTTLRQVDDPDEIKVLALVRPILPPGRTHYHLLIHMPEGNLQRAIRHFIKQIYDCCSG